MRRPIFTHVSKIRVFKNKHRTLGGKNRKYIIRKSDLDAVSNERKRLTFACFLYFRLGFIRNHSSHRHTGENYLGVRAKTAWKILLHKNILMVWSMNDFTYFIICLKIKKVIIIFKKQSNFSVKRWLIGINKCANALICTQLIKKYKFIVNGLIKTV